MPFGLIFGAVFYTVVFLLVGYRLLAIAFGFGSVVYSPGMVPAEAFLALTMLGLVAGLVMRQAWARWAGAVLGVLLTVLIGMLALRLQTADTILVLFASALTTVLLVVPATGDVRNGRREGRAAPSRAGRYLGLAVALTTAGFLAALVLAPVFEGPPEPVAEQAAPVQTRVVWSDYGPGLEKAIAEEKPVLVSFYTDWCGFCKKMDRSTFRDPSVIETLNRMVPVRVDAEDTSAIHGYRGTELATKYRVGTFPTLVLLDSGGHEIARARGYRNAGQLLGWLKSSVERF